VRVRILNKYYTLKRPRLRGSVHGYCDAPTTPSKAILIDKKLNNQQELEIILHECLHAGLWFVCESVVERLAADLARILYRQGYRK